MNDNEREAKEYYESRGYDVIKNGIPDFILLKNGEIKWREHKTGCDTLSESQERAHALLEKHGQDVGIIRTVQKEESKLKKKFNGGDKLESNS